MNTTEINKKFAEFLGWEEQTNPSERFFGTFKTQEGIMHKIPLQFHNDWDWIMFVVKSIADKTGHELVSGYTYSYWNKFGENTLDREFGGYEDITNIYEACSSFIDWYNERTK